MLMMLSVRFLPMQMILLSNLNEIGLLVCGSGLTWLLNGNLIFGTLLIEAGIGLLISVLGKLNVFKLIPQITLVILMLKWKGLSYMKFFCKMEGLSFLDCPGVFTLVQEPAKRPSYYLKSSMLQFQICYHSQLNVS